MKPKTFASMVSNMLYERRFGPFFVEPIVAGLDPVTFEPYVCNMDLIGCINNPSDFIGMLAFLTFNGIEGLSVLCPRLVSVTSYIV